MTDNQSLLIDDFSGFFELSQFPAIFAKCIANAAGYFLFFRIVHDIWAVNGSLKGDYFAWFSLLLGLDVLGSDIYTFNNYFADFRICL